MLLKSKKVDEKQSIPENLIQIVSTLLTSTASIGYHVQEPQIRQRLATCPTYGCAEYDIFVGIKAKQNQQQTYAITSARPSFLIDLRTGMQVKEVSHHV